MTKRRNGKVARLPKAVREIINRLIDDNVTNNVIVKRLDELGYPGFNDMNIHNWEIGGYRDWHVEHERLADISFENLSSINDEYPSAAGLASMRLASQQLNNVLTEFDPAHLRKRLEKRPEYYFQIMLAYSRLLKNTNAFEAKIRAEAYEKIQLESRNLAKQSKKETPEPPGLPVVQGKEGESAPAVPGCESQLPSPDPGPVQRAEE